LLETTTPPTLPTTDDDAPTRRAPLPPPLPTHWVEMPTGEGDSYFWNEQTDECVWERPDAAPAAAAPANGATGAAPAIAAGWRGSTRASSALQARLRGLDRRLRGGALAPLVAELVAERHGAANHVNVRRARRRRARCSRARTAVEPSSPSSRRARAVVRRTAALTKHRRALPVSHVHCCDGDPDRRSARCYTAPRACLAARSAAARTGDPRQTAATSSAEAP
jgi:hypothetical protein